MRMRREMPGDTRQTWCYNGRGVIEGRDCYVWKRYLEQPDPVTGYHTMAYAHPVASFWPE